MLAWLTLLIGGVSMLNMRRALTLLMVFAVLVTCLVCPVMQMLDRWDHEFQTGQDSESALVLVALCLGVTFSLVQAIIRIYRCSPAINSSVCSLLSGTPKILIGAAAAALISASPPPAILRI